MPQEDVHGTPVANGIWKYNVPLNAAGFVNKPFQIIALLRWIMGVHHPLHRQSTNLH